MEHPATEHRVPWKERDLIIVAVSIVLLIGLLELILWGLGLGAFLEKKLHKSLTIFILFILQEVALIAPVLFFIVRKYKPSLVQLGFKKIPVWKCLKEIGRGYLIVLLFVFGLTTFMSWSGAIPGFGTQESIVEFFGTSVLDIILAVIAVVFIAPVVEEVLFRGVLLQGLMNSLKPIYASIFTAAFFALVHFEPAVVGMIAVLGLVLNSLFLRTKSLAPTIGFHIIQNSLALALDVLIKKGIIHL